MKNAFSIVAVLAACASLALPARADQVIFDEGLKNNWENWSWAEVAVSTTVAHSGSKSFSVKADAWEAAYFRNGFIDTPLYTDVSFWIHGGAAGGQRLAVRATRSAAVQPPVIEIPALKAGWQQVTVSLAALQVAGHNDFDGIWVVDRTGTTQPVFYLDDIVLVGAPVSDVFAVTVDASAGRHPISDLVYGTAFASAAQLADLNAPLNRSGGNAETRYNWELNAHNHASDYYFESLADDSAVPGERADTFVADSKAGGAEPMLTVPMIGWAPKLGPNRGKLASFSVKKYGPQTGNDAQWFPDAGNGIKVAGNPPVYVTGNDPSDANVAVDSAFAQRWLQHLKTRWGAAAGGGVRYYLLDNEPSIWQGTHRDVHPVGPKMQEIRDRSFEYAAMIKSVDTGATVLGPEEWGWSGYLYSGFDQQYAAAHNYTSFPDHDANGGMDFLPWYLDQMRQKGAQLGRRLLDVCTVHYYPQGGEFGDDVSPAMQLTRNRSTRSLWDPAYKDPTWIQAIVRLVPRLREWVAQYYPGTKIGLTEYNWGAEGHINGATAQADILGILGREGIDLATRWTTPKAGTPVYNAIKMYRNYDGRKSSFGDLSVSAVGGNPDHVAVFAALRSKDSALTLMAINKDLTATNKLELSLANFAAKGVAEVWRLDSANAIKRLPDSSFTGPKWTNSLPPQSISLLVLAPDSLQLTASLAPANKVQLTVRSQGGAHFVLQSSTDLRSWTPIYNDNSGAAATTAEFPLGPGTVFYRGVTAP